MEIGYADVLRHTRWNAYARWQALAEGHETAAKLAAALVLALLTGALAQVEVHTPLTPVPYTLQVLGISLMGGLLGAAWGTLSASLYVGLGLLGFPVWAGQVGDAGGLGAAFGDFQWFGGWAALGTMLSAGYLFGFVAQAAIIGWLVDRRARQRHVPLVALGAAAGVLLLGFALLDAYLLADYATLYPASPTAFPNPWFAILVAGELVLVASLAWLAGTTKARRERVELFLANVVALVALYAVGAVGFLLVWNHLGLGPLAALDLLRFTVIPFVPADLSKILLAIGLLTLVRPTQDERARRATR